jgi:hypothetical protein
MGSRVGDTEPKTTVGTVERDVGLDAMGLGHLSSDARDMEPTIERTLRTIRTFYKSISTIPIIESSSSL